MRRMCLLALLCMFPLFGWACGEAPQGPPRPLVDRDGDGVANQQLGGRDCNDNDATIPSGLDEIAGNQKDDNCNGQVDEMWGKSGYWRLTTPSQPTAFWDIDVHTEPQLAVQYMRCLQFKFKLQSSNGNINHVEQWQTAMPYKDSMFKDGKFTWKLDDPKQTIKVDFEGTLKTATTMSGTITVRDVNPQVNVKVTLPFTGVFVQALPKDDARKSFCLRCYGNESCKPPI